MDKIKAQLEGLSACIFKLTPEEGVSQQVKDIIKESLDVLVKNGASKAQQAQTLMLIRKIIIGVFPDLLDVFIKRLIIETICTEGIPETEEEFVRLYGDKPAAVDPCEDPEKTTKHDLPKIDE